MTNSTPVSLRLPGYQYSGWPRFQLNAAFAIVSVNHFPVFYKKNIQNSQEIFSEL